MPVTGAVITEYLAKVPASIFQRGKSIYEAQTPDDEFDDEEIFIEEEGPRSIVYGVPSQSGDFEYFVKLSWTAKKLSARCECIAFEDYGYCKHIVAAILELQSSVPIPDRNADIEEAIIVAQSSESEPEMKPGIVRNVKRTFIAKPWQVLQTIDWNIGYRNNSAELAKIVDSSVDLDAGNWDFTYRQSEKTSFHPRIHYDRRESFVLSCTCKVDKPACPHLIAVAKVIRLKFGTGYFAQFRDWSIEKAAILKKLGLEPDDPEAEAVKFTVDSWGELRHIAPDWLWHKDRLNDQLGRLFRDLALETPNPTADDQLGESATMMIPAFAFYTSPVSLPFMLELVVLNVAGGKFARIALDNPDRLKELRKVLPHGIAQAIESISHTALNHGLDAAGSQHKIPNGVQHMRPGDRSTQYLFNRYADVLETLWPLLADPATEVYTTAESPVTRKNCTPIRISERRMRVHLNITKSPKFIELRPAFRDAVTGSLIDEEIAVVGGGLLLRSADEWFLPEHNDSRNLLRQFPAGFLKIPVASLETLYTQILPSLRSRYEVELSEELRPKIHKESPEPYLQFTERSGKFLLLVPRFRYGTADLLYDADPQPVLYRDGDGAWVELRRDGAAERAFAESIRELHPDFSAARSLQTFSIPFATALEDSWYQKTLATIAERGVEVSGLDALEHFRYNPHQAKVSVSSRESGSGIDWFDILIEISFGDVQVSLKDVRKALISGQAGVRLSDGSIGLLPDDFISQYGALLKLGKDKGEGRLSVNKMHFTLIDQLHEALLSQDMKAEIAAKKSALQAIEHIETVDVPASINASLRPYQLAGFHWMQVLDKLGWGGCLADDMGLGKTLQTITFLQHLKDERPGETHLVICPTSLVFNWQSELEKFAPELRYRVHYGAGRVWNAEILDDVDIVITTYGLVRSDLEALTAVQWGYVILDESQAIKNPEAQTTKAVQVLRAKNRLCLSGTPLQNNTFDLYAQFEFLNPGLFGSRDFFRTEFATPIDKQGDEKARGLLRKMLAPFMLRRTKEQVAKDLPDKTEVTLWCEMESEQRAVYDEYRKFYRDSLLKRIDEDGMQGSSIYILEALLRMRQLCDHPELVKNKAVKTNESIKLDELLREIRENAGGRKVLVFSQFTEMLALIRKAFDKEGIGYAYLDGATPAAKRKTAVEEFQTDPALQVFLISLKAGGVGLNLTAAEYVYIVDPWWNPAVEAQAIDRTHRIGQQNKIVAYRMICKDTVEEKVMLLQSRKRALAEGLVTEDAGFVKKLTREDVAFLLE